MSVPSSRIVNDSNDGLCCQKIANAVFDLCHTLNDPLAVSIGLIAFVRVIAPFPGGVIYVGDFELDPHRTEHVAKPAGLRTNLEKHY